MQKLFVAKQKILNRDGKVFANELLFRDYEDGIKNFPSNIQATSNVLINVLINANEILNETTVVLVNVDEKFLMSGLIDLLDKDKFMLEILETTDLSEKVVNRIKLYHKRGFKIAIDDFDCSAQMIKKFTPIFKYIHLLKIDLLEAEHENLLSVIKKFKSLGMKLLAEKIETKEDYKECLDLGFDLFQGYGVHRPESVEIDRGKDITQYIVLNVIKLIKNDADTNAIEAYLKQRSELSFKLVQFLNAQVKFDIEIKSVKQAITLLGRDRLLRWLFLYLYSEMSENPISETILDLSIQRAQLMEDNAAPADKDRAYLAGMFSLLGAMFDREDEELLKGIKLHKDIADLVLRKKGKFLSSLIKSQEKEKVYLKKVCMENFYKIDPIDILYVLEMNGIEIDTDKL